MRVKYLPRPIEGTRYTKNKPYLPLDICMKAFVELSDGRVVGPFKGAREGENWMWKMRGYWGNDEEIPFNKTYI